MGTTDQGWHRFTDLLGYRLKWRGKELIRMRRFEPSSRLCSKCVNIKRASHCDARGFTIDRDLNPHSINIMKLGLSKVWECIPEHKVRL